MSQAEFAKLYGVSLDRYILWERGLALPDWQDSIAFLSMLGNGARERFGIHMGMVLDEIRGETSELRARALDALALVMERSSPLDQARWCKIMEDAAAGCAGLKKRPVSVTRPQRKRRSESGD